MQIACLQMQRLDIRIKSKAGGLDPFSSDFVGEKSDVVPPVSGCDLVSYLVLQTSFITSKQFKAHKFLEAYNQFVSGWVKDILQTHIVSVDIPPLLSFSSLSTAFDFAATPGTLHFLFAFCSRLVAARRLFEYLINVAVTWAFLTYTRKIQ